MQCGYTILIIDDDQQGLDMLRLALSLYGYQVFIADDGERGYQQAIFTQPALILLDVNMPGLDGVETCQKLRGNRRTRHIPIFFTTGRTDIAADGFKVGIDDYIVKPFRVGRLLEKIRCQLDATPPGHLQAQLYGPQLF